MIEKIGAFFTSKMVFLQLLDLFVNKGLKVFQNPCDDVCPVFERNPP